MAVTANKRSIMTLYSGRSDPYSHRVRIVLAEKGVTVDIIDINASSKAIEELASYNPYGTIPTLVDRDLVLYKSEIIMEYIDERFPHPPLMPVYPIAKGRTRLMIHRVNHDWYSLMDIILNQNEQPKIVEQARQNLSDSLTSITPVFAEMPYFLSEEFSLIDCCIAPLLWRLPLLGVKLPQQAQAIMNYAERVFQRPSFQASLTDVERMMRT
jgi:RNA polymerase-associated protein